MAPLTYSQEIYTYDIDSSRHVSNITYIQWLEIARNKLTTKAGLPVHEIEKLGFAPVITKTEITYKKPLYLGDTVRVEVFLSSLKRISGTISCNFYNVKDEIVAEAKQETLFISLETKRPYKLSEEQRLCFVPFVVEA